jgi:hypothetical protein
MKITKGAIFIFFFTLLLSCNKESAPDFLQTSGKIKTVERNVADFTEIELFNTIDLVLTQDTLNKLSIEAGENLIPDILTEVKEGKLQIKNSNKFNFLRSYKKKITVFLSCNNLKQITYRGAGNISTTNTLTDSVINFDCHKGTGEVNLHISAKEGHFNTHTGQSTLILTGNIGVNYIYQAGNGYIDATELKTGYTFVTNKGTNDLKINVDYELFARISYLGNIYYKGNPVNLGSEITDKGQLIKIQE